jgi:DNA gyrase/topoisomerase IV subunit A
MCTWLGWLWQVALVDGVPRTLTLRQFLVNFLEFRVGVVERRARHQLGVAQERLHLVEGYLSALSQLDGVVQVRGEHGLRGVQWKNTCYSGSASLFA